ncbi:Protein MFI [Apodemus speciosus]|uniref:Protein MFI n=1 Tax=Apodemus speciosus TaxID=105296 RepID=A0ABQ0FUP1_APOSI
MEKSSNTSVSGAPKSDSQLSEKLHKTQSARAAKIKARKDTREISATKIQNAWFIYVDKTLFKLLKHTVCAAEYCVAHELLKKVSPIEAALLKDPSMKCKVRFRFSGETFPPCIVFKIFFKSDGYGYKYFSGKNLLKPSSKLHHLSCWVSIIHVSENLLINRRKTTGA